MEVMSQKLAAIYTKLEASNLVQTKKATPENVEQFKNILNEAVPITLYDTSVGEVTRFYHKANKFSFNRFLESSGLPHFVLLTNEFPIVKAFGLIGIIMIEWNKKTGKFDVMSGARPKGDVVHTTNETTPKTRMSRDKNGRKPRIDRPREPVRDPAETRYRIKIAPLSIQEYNSILTTLNTGAKTYSQAVSEPPALASEVALDTPRYAGKWGDCED